jgi:hypothetical protein
LTFAAAVLGLHPPKSESRPTCKGGWSPATSVSQKWAILGSNQWSCASYES